MQCIRKGLGRSLGAVSIGEQGIDVYPWPSVAAMASLNIV
jgi:hypothetical protein